MGKASNGNVPLHKTLHFRKLRSLVTLLCKYENINANEYDLYDMRAYSCYGVSLQGKNVVCKAGTSTGRSVFINSNEYDIIEIPKKTNRNTATGNFLTLVYNKTFDYWVLCKFSYYVNVPEARKGNFSDRVEYKPLGKYTVIFRDYDQIVASKEEDGYRCGFGKNNNTAIFDSCNVRKTAYGVTKSELLANTLGYENNGKKTVIDNTAVNIYRKKKKKY